MNRRTAIAPIVLAAIIAAQGATATADEAKPLRMLWVGSSSLYYHNMPKVCAEWLTSVAKTPAESYLVGRSGTGVHVYLRDDFKAEYGLKPGQTMLEKIAHEKFAYVVLQIPAEFIAGPEGDEHDKSIDVYCQAIRAAAGKPVIYEMGWQRNAQARVGREKIFAAAVRNRATLFVPCSTAWERVRTERPELDLQNATDRTHPGTLGAYLNLCCFHATLVGKPPVDLPTELRVWRRLDDDEKREADEALKQTTLDAYDARLSGWMKRLVVAAKKETIDARVAAYLQQTAWDEHQSVQKRLQQAIERQEK